MKTLKTDVIIPAYRPGEEFEKLLERLSAQKYPINKILVMNTEKKFWKEIWEQKYPLVEVISRKQNLITAAPGKKQPRCLRQISWYL